MTYNIVNKVRYYNKIIIKNILHWKERVTIRFSKLLKEIIKVIDYFSKKNKTRNNHSNNNDNIKNRNNYSNNKYDKSISIEEKGYVGEINIIKELKNISNLGYYKTFRNLYIPKARNKEETTEIDIILVCAYGIFVIESKNYNGNIYGNSNYTKWKQYLNSKIPNEFYNPIKQNKIHINALKKVLKLDNVIKSLIIFSNDCKLKITNEEENVDIIQLNDLNMYIKSFDKKLLTREDIDIISKKLQEYNGVNISQNIKNEHINNIKKRR